MPVDPFLHPVEGADAVFVLPRPHLAGGIGEGLPQPADVVGEDEGADDRPIFQQLLRAHAENLGHAGTCVGKAHPAVGLHDGLIEAPRYDLGDSVVALLQLQAADRVGDLAERSIVVFGPSGSRIAHQAHALLDPDSFAGLVAIDLRADVRNLAVLFEHRVDFGAAGWVDVPLAGDVVHLGQHLRLAVEAIEAHEGGIGADHAPAERRTEDAFADVVVEIVEAPRRRVGLGQGELAIDDEHDQPCHERRKNDDEHQQGRGIGGQRIREIHALVRVPRLRTENNSALWDLEASRPKASNRYRPRSTLELVTSTEDRSIQPHLAARSTEMFSGAGSRIGAAY